MAGPLRLLLVEDSEDDALLILRSLRRSEFELSFRIVQTAAAFRNALATQFWDVVIADYQLPQFSAPEALRILQESGLDLPFIVASGTIGEQHAVELMRNGAHDYVMKDRLSRLIEAVRREIREAAGRAERRKTEAALQSLIIGTAAVTGADFFAALVRHIAQILDIEYVLVTALAGDQLHTLAYWGAGALQPPFSYPIADTPCEQTLRDGMYVQSAGLQEMYIGKGFLQWANVSDYLGIALHNVRGQPIGNLCILSHAPFQSAERTGELLRLFAARAAAELERQQATSALEALNRDLEAIVAQRTAELRDVNQQLLAANIELAHATRAKDSFLASMSHELRTPLNAILGLSESLQIEVYGPLAERQQQVVATIEQSGRHLLALINDVLDLGKIASGKLELRSEPVELYWLCENSMVFVREQAIRKRLQLTSHIPPELHTQRIIVDDLRIRQALINLLANAVAYTPEGGRVELSCEICGLEGSEPRLCIRVNDTGLGIAAADLERIFEPFERIEATAGLHSQGTGLGLTLVRRIVELHQGTITVESRPGHGSCFTMTLPFTPAPAPAALAHSEPEPVLPAPGSAAAPLILLAEDDARSAMVVKDYLTAYGFRLLHAENGAIALALAQAERPDLILMDIQMPEMDGVAAAQQIRGDPQLAAIPIIALTAQAMHGDQERFLAAGINAVLTKPLILRQLYGLVLSLLPARATPEPIG